MPPGGALSPKVVSSLHAPPPGSSLKCVRNAELQARPGLLNQESREGPWVRKFPRRFLCASVRETPARTSPLACVLSGELGAGVPPAPPLEHRPCGMSVGCRLVDTPANLSACCAPALSGAAETLPCPLRPVSSGAQGGLARSFGSQWLGAPAATAPGYSVRLPLGVPRAGPGPALHLPGRCPGPRPPPPASPPMFMLFPPLVAVFKSIGVCLDK